MPRSRRRTGSLGITLGLGTALTLALTTAGCAAPADGPEAAAGAPGSTTLTSCGRQLTVAAPPRRAVTLDQNSTELLLELGLGARMAGTANLKTKVAGEYRDAYAKVPVLSPKVLGGEQLRAAEPDFVLGGSAELYTGDRAGTREELGALGLPAFVSAVDCPELSRPPRPAFELLFDDYLALGRAFGVTDRAERLAAGQRERVALAAATAGRVQGAPTVVWLYSSFNGTPYVAGGTGMPHEMSRLVGARNAFDDVAEDWPEVTWEEIAARDPDFLVIGDLSERGKPGDSAAEKRALLTGHPVVSKLRAVRENRIVEVPGIEMDPSVRSVHALELLAAGMKDLGHVR
ncbi:ABC transporter substrate-binding protein [Streptomyces sp. NPDC051567]|uniref:ABC transporter substrate-binding protein n=1 Tax=Streptomyces sp. NPDC051567 TaxID=3365660 RepID=UPI0037A18914